MDSDWMRGNRPSAGRVTDAGVDSSDLIARCLENEGVRYVFGVPGEEILDIVDSLSGSRVRFVPHTPLPSGERAG